MFCSVLGGGGRGAGYSQCQYKCQFLAAEGKCMTCYIKKVCGMQWHLRKENEVVLSYRWQFHLASGQGVWSRGDGGRYFWMIFKELWNFLNFLNFFQETCPTFLNGRKNSSKSYLINSLQSLPASGSFPVSQLITSGGQSIGVSVSASVLPMNIQDWFPLGWTGLISL